MISMLRRFQTDDRGATAIEYGLICGLIFLVIVSAVTLFSDRATAMFTYVSTTIDSVL